MESARASTPVGGVLTAWFSRDAVAAHRAMLFIVGLMVVANLLVGERVTAGGGLGWDGVVYARIVRTLDDMVRTGTLGTYYAQRVLPAFAVRTIMLTFGVPFTDGNIIRTFALFNGVLAIALVWVWRGLADALALPIAGRWVGFTGLVLTFEFAKQNMYYPVLTDAAALLCSATMLLFYIKRSSMALVAASVIGGFCWPTLAVTGAILLLFMPRVEQEAPGPPPATWRLSIMSGLPMILLLVATAALVLVRLPLVHGLCVRSGILPAVLHAFPSGIDAQLARYRVLDDPCLIAQQVLTVIPSLILLGLALIILLWPLLREASWKIENRAYAMRQAVLAAAVLAITTIGIRWIANPAVPNPSSVLLLAKLIILAPPGKVLLPWLGVAVFWGPILIVAALRWPQVSAEARRLGAGIPIAIAFTMPLILVGESRFITSIWPMLVVASAIMLGRPHPRRFYVVFVGFAVLLAQFWLPLNLVPWPGGDFEYLQGFPKQLYFMHHGMWMGWPAYAAQSAVVLLMGIILAHQLRQPVDSQS